MDINDLRGKSRSDQFAIAAKYAGVSADVLEKQWARESNRGDPKYMLSPAGARGHFGLMPATQKAWETRTGQKLDPNDFTDGLYMAALTMGENMKATGNVADALRMYNAGNNRDKWDNKETRGYVAYILGTDPGTADRLRTQAPSTKRLDDMSDEEIIFGRKEDTKDPGPRGVRVSAGDMAARALSVAPRTVDDRTTIAFEDARQREGNAVFQEAYKDSLTVGDKFAAGFHEGGLFDGAVHMLERAMAPNDQAHSRWLSDNLKTVWADAKMDDDAAHMLLSTNSKVEYDHALEWIEEKHENQRALSAVGPVEGTAWTLAGGAADPVSLVAGGLISKGFRAAQIGSEVYFNSGKFAMGVLSSGGENALANVLGTAALQASGEVETPQDYLLSGASGFILGGLVGAGVHGRQIARTEKAKLVAKAEDALPEGAEPHEIAAKVDEMVTDDHRAAIGQQLANVSDERRLMPMKASDVLAATPADRQAIIDRHGLDIMSDSSEQAMTAEIIANAERVNKAIPTNDKGLTHVTGWLPGAESPAMSGLKSDSKVLQAASKTIMENTTGAGGRGVTAANTAAVYERMLQANLHRYDDLVSAFAKAEGISWSKQFLSAEATKAFGRRVFYEIESRKPGKISTEASPIVKAAADAVEKGMEAARLMQQEARVAGWARLGDTSKGYITHRLSVEKVAKLKPEQMTAVYDMLSKQMQELNTYRVAEDGKEVIKHWDKKFSDEMARAYIERATQKQAGMYEIPVNLHEPEAADLLEDVMEGLGLDYKERKEALGSIGRGGAGYTKQRIQFDMTAPIPDGNGGVMPVGDLFEHDIQGLYRAYMRRASGEIALATHGILGTKGLKMLRQAAVAELKGSGKLNDPKNMKALKGFDQVASELLNQSFGDNRHTWMDNINIATSASRLGMAVFNQMGDYSNSLVALGVARTAAQIPAIPRLFKEVGMLAKGGTPKNPILHSLDRMGGVGLDDYYATRLMDTRDHNVVIYGQNSVGHFGQILRRVGDAQYIINGHRRLVAVQARGASEQIVRKALRYIKNGQESKALDDMGFTGAIREKIKRNLDNITTWDKYGEAKEIDFSKGDLTWADQVEIRGIVDRGGGQIIQRTYPGETGPWVHDSQLSLLYKFRTYGLTAMEKQWSRNTMNHGHVVAFASLVGAIGWAMPIYAARVHVASLGMSRSKREEYIEDKMKWEAVARNVMNYGSSFGLTGDIIDVGATYATSFRDSPAAEFAGRMGTGGKYGGGSLLGNTVAPGLGVIEDVWQGSHQLADRTDGTAGAGWRKLAKVLPGSNLPFVQPMFNAFEDEN
ncbi:internal virion protein [Caulobacter phage Percy]|uniref:Internal virion protein n=1 Tax=Caulobacter phage Percy TaxID=1701809 RepID=A0A0M4QVY5_9CAUD|nr:internal virion protein with endolysin domain [Caulobacter phage Percy]ALF01678.1 internal virion protein [Caulobacter phage Percy]